MSQLSQFVDSLEKKIDQLLHQHQELKRQHQSLQKELMQVKTQHESDLEEIDRWKEKFETLKVASSMLGSDQYKRDTKLKINALIREIDLCIAQLSE